MLWLKDAAKNLKKIHDDTAPARRTVMQHAYRHTYTVGTADYIDVGDSDMREPTVIYDRFCMTAVPADWDIFPQGGVPAGCSGSSTLPLHMRSNGEAPESRNQHHGLLNP